MRQIRMLVLAFSLLILALPATATDGTTLSDYETSGKEQYKTACDNKTTKVITYHFVRLLIPHCFSWLDQFEVVVTGSLIWQNRF